MQKRQNKRFEYHLNDTFSNIINDKTEQLLQHEEEREKKEQMQQMQQMQQNYKYWNEKLPLEVKSMYGDKFGGRIVKNNNKKPKKISEKVKKPKKVF